MHVAFPDVSDIYVRADPNAVMNSCLWTTAVLKDNYFNQTNYFIHVMTEWHYSGNSMDKHKIPHDLRHSRAGVFNPRPTGHLRPSGEFCAAREGYFTKYNAL